jgi:hypothetical protein
MLSVSKNQRSELPIGMENPPLAGDDRCRCPAAVQTVQCGARRHSGLGQATAKLQGSLQARQEIRQEIRDECPVAFLVNAARARPVNAEQAKLTLRYRNHGSDEVEYP